MKLLSCSTQLKMKYIMFVNDKMPLIVGILAFISRINTTSECSKQKKMLFFLYLTFCEQLNFHGKFMHNF